MGQGWDWRFAGALAALAAASAVAAHAGSAEIASAVTVAQRDISFAPGRIELKAGGKVTFVNEDPFGHNVFSESKGGEFDIGRQQPGQQSVVTFRNPGTFVAECRIHPKMHLEIVVLP